MMFLRKPFMLLVTGVFLFSCTKKDIEFANGLGETHTKIMQVDTVGVNLSTYVVDSFVTNSTSEFIAGSYSDSLLGNIKAKAYVQLMPSLATALEDNAVYDSLSFVIKLNGYYYGDTTQLQTVTINELDAPIEYKYGSYIYNTSSFAEKTTPLGAISRRIYPARNDSIVVKMDNLKGVELFNLIKQSAGEMQTAEAFLNYFKGVAINFTSANPSAVYGFNKTADSVYMRLHYHTTTPYPEAKYKDFSFYNSTYYSNQIIANRSATTLAGIINTEINASQTGNKAFTQAATGVLLKMTFPSLRTILQLDPTVKLLKATLVLKVPQDSYDGKLPLPQNLFLVQTDASNTMGAVVYNSTGEYIVTASPSYDNIYGATTSYAFEITSYFSSLLITAGSENNGFFLVENVPGGFVRPNRAVITNSAAAVEGSQLILSLLTLKN